MISWDHTASHNISRRGVFTSLRENPTQSLAEFPQHYLSSLEPWFFWPPSTTRLTSSLKRSFAGGIALDQRLLKNCIAPLELSLGLDSV